MRLAFSRSVVAVSEPKDRVLEDNFERGLISRTPDQNFLGFEWFPASFAKKY